MRTQRVAPRARLREGTGRLQELWECECCFFIMIDFLRKRAGVYACVAKGIRSASVEAGRCHGYRQ